jgi:leishmanolysin/Big-like domain-containing protein
MFAVPLPEFSMHLRRPLALVAVTLLVTATCKKDGSGPPVPTNIVINTSAVSLASINQTSQLSAVVLDQNGAAMTGQPLTWQSSPTSVAQVSGTGLVTAVGNGSAQVTAHVGTLSSLPTTVTVAQVATALAKITGDAQTDTVGQALATALTVQANDGLGNPVPGVTVNFSVFGGGNISAPSGITAANGRTAVTWTLGTVSGAQSVGATASGASGATFAATALPDAPTSVVAQAGNNQTGPIGLAVPVDPAVQVRDQYNNGVPGRTVTYVVQTGGGSLTGATPVTNGSGIAAVGSWTLGTAGSNTLDATVGGGGSITGNPVTFTATGTVAGAPASVAVSAGNNQTGLVGYAVNVPPAVIVQDAASAPVPNVEVTFAVTGGGGSIVGQLVDTTGPSGIATVAGWVIGNAPGANTLTATATPGGLTGNPVSFTATGQTAAYNIVIRYVVPPSAAQQAGIDSAVARWQRSIYGDVVDIPNVNVAANTCVSGQAAINNETIDDIVIYVKLDSIDGPLNVLGQAGPCFHRLPGHLPLIGVMFFDTADVAPMISAGQWDEVAMHEMGHALGYGTEWLNEGLLVDPTSQGGTDPHFVGPEALAAFDREGGVTYSAGAKVPVENTGGSGTRDGHWRESVFNTEVMTGFIDQGVPNPFSVISAAAMADLAYLVNYASSEAYTVANPLALRTQGTGQRLHLRDDILRIPIFEVDRNGRVTRVIQPR